jgi:starch-binding outer membrane protein, SusD/RagB family
MKKIKFIVIAFIGIILINSCAESDLNLKDPNFESLKLEELITKESDVAGLVSKCYVNARSVALYGRLIPYMMDNMAQENGSNPQEEADKKTFADFSFTAGNTQISEYWTSCYGGIKKCNFILSNETILNGIKDPVLTKDRLTRYLGEAHFMRGFYYFLLVNRFGGVTLLDRQATSASDIRGRSTKKEIFDLIVSDFKFAASALSDKSVEAKGRANKSAALSMLGKALLYQKDYAGALTTFNTVTGYSLTSEYYDNFVEEKEYGSESIFEIDFDLSRGTGNKWGNNVDGEGAGTANNTFRGQDYGHLDWFNVWPNDNLANSFESGDKRIAGTIYNYGDKYLNDKETVLKARKVFRSNGQPVIDPKTGLQKVTDDFGGLAPRAWKKYQNYYKQKSENQESGINFKIIRFADILLMKAECENEVGSQATAIGYINQVRARAGVPALATSLSKADVFKAIVHERKVEFAGEQSRFDDIIRWGIASTELAGSNFKSNKNELWPIPSTVFAANVLYKPSDQNPGY